MTVRHPSKQVYIAVIVILSFLFVSPCYAKITEKQLSTKTLRSMSRAYMAFGRYEKAHVLAERALKQAKSGRTETGEMALCLIDMGTVCSYQGLLSQSRDFLERGIDLQKQALFDSHPYVAQTLRMLSDVCRRQGDLTRAEAVLAQAVQIMLEHCDLESKEMAPFILESAILQCELGHLEQAQLNYQKALHLYEQHYGARHLMTANVLEKMAQMSLVQDNTERANEYMTRSLTIKNAILGRYHPMLIDSWLEMARICKQHGQVERCEYYLAKSTETASQSRNAITMARVYEQVNEIRKQTLIAAAIPAEMPR